MKTEILVHVVSVNTLYAIKLFAYYNHVPTFSVGLQYTTISCKL
jgi:hypothetical protein